MNRMKKLGWILIVLLLAGAAAWYWSSANGAEEIPPETTLVTRGTLELTAAASGTVEPQLQVDVKSRASGEVIEVTVKEGDRVEAGQLLVRLDPSDEERNVQNAEASLTSALSRLSQAEASLASARTSLTQDRDRFERRRAAFTAGLVSGEDLQSYRITSENSARTVTQREADVRSAGADVEKARLTIEDYRKRLEETIIKAPVSGTVLAVNVEKGTIVSSGISNVGGGTTLLTMADLSRLFVLAKLDEADIGSVKLGQEARMTVDAFSNRVFRGVVERITPLGISTSNVVTFDVRIEITDPASRLLLPGMTADVEIVTSRDEGVLLLPSAAVHRERRGRGNGSRGPGGRDASAGASGPADSIPSPAATASPADTSTGTPERAGRRWRTDGESLSREGRRDTGARERWERRPGGDSGPAEHRSWGSFPAPDAGIGLASSAPRMQSRGWVKRVSGETVPVTIGATDGVSVVILEGLSEGDEVILSDGKDTSTAAQRSSNPFAMGRPPRR